MHNETTEFRHLETRQVLTTIARLQQERRYRDSRGLFFAEGIRNFIQAIDHQYPLEALLYSERLLIQPLARKLVRRLKRAGVPFARISPEEFRSASRNERASGVGAILRQRFNPLSEIVPGEQQIWTAMSQVRSPGNFGTLLRTSAAAGAAGFVLLGDSIDPFDPAAVRAAMGALFTQSLVRTSTPQLRDWARLHDVPIIGASPDGDLVYDRVRYTRPAILLLGGERKGLTSEERSLCRHIVRIPMVTGTDSLNVAVAGSLVMYEICRSTSG
jgi:TrmH family RNA methyltransferase